MWKRPPAVDVDAPPVGDNDVLDSAAATPVPTTPPADTDGARDAPSPATTTSGPAVPAHLAGRALPDRWAEIVGHQVHDDKVKKYMAYRVWVTATASSSDDSTPTSTSWIVWKRYSEFFALDHKLTKQYPNTRFPSFPPKRLFGSSVDEPLARLRTAKINRYLAFVFDVPALRAAPAVAEFFEFDAHLGGEGSADVRAAVLDDAAVEPSADHDETADGEEVAAPVEPTSGDARARAGSDASTQTLKSVDTRDPSSSATATPTTPPPAGETKAGKGKTKKPKQKKPDDGISPKAALSQVKHRTSKIIRRVGRAYSNVENAVADRFGNTANAAAAERAVDEDGVNASGPASAPAALDLAITPTTESASHH
ncbi:hypothetical protein AMAG_19849, partial [Allomyces macrogynus ATCC 38327]